MWIQTEISACENKRAEFIPRKISSAVATQDWVEPRNLWALQSPPGAIPEVWSTPPPNSLQHSHKSQPEICWVSFFCQEKQVIVFNFLLQVTHVQLHKDSLSSLRSKREERPFRAALDENTKQRRCHSPQRESQLLLSRTALASAQNAAGSS